MASCATGDTGGRLQNEVEVWHDYWLTWGEDCGTIVNRKPSSVAGWDDEAVDSGV